MNNVMYFISNNLGDNLNFILLKKMIAKSTSFVHKDANNKLIDKRVKLLNEIAKTDFFFIGSILETISNWTHLIQNKKDYYKSTISKWYFKIYDYFHPLIIFGSGFMFPMEKNETYIRNIKIISVRGNVTLQRFRKNRINVDDSVILADPAILSPIILYLNKTKNHKKIYNLCLIPHYHDSNDILIKERIHVHKILILNIKNEVFKFFESLQKCKRVLSSSLHGLILSDAFRIPNLRMILGNKIVAKNYRFEDYYSAYGLDLPIYIDLRKRNFTDDELHLIDSSYNISTDMIQKKQCQLLFHFPYRLKKNYLNFKKICKITYGF